MQQFDLKFVNSLHDDHVATLALLEKMESTISKQGKGNCPTEISDEMRSMLNDMTAIMTAEITGHFAFEEEYLFPRFAAAADNAIPMMLKGEHDVIRPLAKQLTDMAKKAKTDGFDQQTWEIFYDLGLEIVEREVFHIQKEEMGFLPALDQIIDPDEEDELTMAYAEKKSSI
ncbi:MAG: hemerythrin domain-containing protein [Alphaproteobacteria bacterium]|nr:hemerythrin domain-containing protein [Alphaproteobacteria bacterium]